MSASRTMVVEDERPLRLDAFVHRALPLLSRRLVQRVIRDGTVRVNERPAPKGLLVRAGDRVTLPAIEGLVPEPGLALPVVYEDDALIAIDKPGGMRAHALDPRERGTAAAFLLAHDPSLAGVGDPLAPGLVHRLDTGTSGLLLAARTPAAHAALRAALRARTVDKRYLAVVAGRVAFATPEHVTLALAHDPRARTRMIPAAPGLRAWPAESTVEPLAVGDAHSLVAVTIRTGVTHQVRVHLAHLGHPVLGDTTYGAPHEQLPPGRHALHAVALAFSHPSDARPLALEAALPDDLARLLS